MDHWTVRLRWSRARRAASAVHFRGPGPRRRGLGALRPAGGVDERHGGRRVGVGAPGQVLRGERERRRAVTETVKPGGRGFRQARRAREQRGITRDGLLVRMSEEDWDMVMS